MNQFRSVFILALASASLSVSAQNLVQDSSFENHGTFDLSSFSYAFGLAWTTNSPSSQVVYGNFQNQIASQGRFFAALLPSSGGGVLSQSIATQAGQTYTISFDLQNYDFNSGRSNAFTASFGDGSLALDNVAEAPDYSRYSFTGVASGASTLLSFSARNNDAFFLDNVSVTANRVASVPGPLAALPFALMALQRRRKA